ncbi:MAG: hypothetical protein P8Z68_01935 [Kineosporiaceae bacterium]
MPALLCDVGNVLVEVSLPRVLGLWRAANGGELGVSDPAVLRDDAYRAFQTGGLGESEYARHLRAVLGWRGSDTDLVAYFAEAYGAVNLVVLQVLGELRGEGWHLVGVSNTNPWHDEVLARRFAEPLSVFTRVVASTAVRARKSDPRFLGEAVRGCPPGLRVFTDDRPENVSSARLSGLDAHHFRDAERLRETCLALGAPAG